MSVDALLDVDMPVSLRLAMVCGVLFRSMLDADDEVLLFGALLDTVGFDSASLVAAVVLLFPYELEAVLLPVVEFVVEAAVVESSDFAIS